MTTENQPTSPQHRLQETFDKIQKLNHQIKENRQIISNVYAGSKALKEVEEEMRELRAKQKQIKLALNEELKSEIDRVDRLTTAKSDLQQVLSDIAVTLYAAGITPEVTDSRGNTYEPTITARFNKI